MKTFPHLFELCNKDKKIPSELLLVTSPQQAKLSFTQHLNSLTIDQILLVGLSFFLVMSGSRVLDLLAPLNLDEFYEGYIFTHYFVTLFPVTYYLLMFTYAFAITFIYPQGSLGMRKNGFHFKYNNKSLVLNLKRFGFMFFSLTSFGLWNLSPAFRNFWSKSTQMQFVAQDKAYMNLLYPEHLNAPKLLNLLDSKTELKPAHKKAA